MRQTRLGAVGQLRDLVRKTPLPPMEMAVLLALVEHVHHGRAQRGDYVVWPSVRTLATETGLSRSSVERSLTALVGRSLIVLVKKSTYHEPDRYDVGMRTIAKLVLTTADPAVAQKEARATVAKARAAGAEQKRRVRAEQKRRPSEDVAQTRPVDGPANAEQTRPVDEQTRPVERTDTSSGRLNPEGNPERTPKEPARRFSGSEVRGRDDRARDDGWLPQSTVGSDLRGEMVPFAVATRISTPTTRMVAPTAGCACGHEVYQHRSRRDVRVLAGESREGECVVKDCVCVIVATINAERVTVDDGIVSVKKTVEPPIIAWTDLSAMVTSAMVTGLPCRC